MKNAIMLGTLTFALLTGVAAGQPADPDARTWTLYDVRDLIGLLPPGEEENEADAVDALLTRLCDAFGAPHERLMDGVYGVEANGEAHDLLRRMLLEVRALHAERYVVEIAWYAVTEGDRPVVGKAATPPASAASHSLVVTRRTPVAIEQLVRHRFVSGMTPVVANGVVAYEPQTDAALDGIRAVVAVGASADAEGATTLRLMGAVHRVTLGRLPARLDSGMDTSPAIELPTEATRTLRADVFTPFTQWTTLCVVPGFDEGVTIVVAARVQPTAVD